MIDKHHSRTCAKGREMGANMARLVEPIIKYLESEGEPDERCKSCAFRAGTVPNGCLQTQMDVLKAALEQVQFNCHVNKNPDGTPQMCHGWLASQWGSAGKPIIKCPWEFSPPDEVKA